MMIFDSLLSPQKMMYKTLFFIKIDLWLDSDKKLVIKKKIGIS